MGKKRRRPAQQKIDGESRQTFDLEELNRIAGSAGQDKSLGGKCTGKKQKKGAGGKKAGGEQKCLGIHRKETCDGDIAALDDIFEQLKKPETVENKVPKDTEKVEATEPTVPIAGNKDDIFGNKKGPGRKRTEEGYCIYGEDELGLGKEGGDTPLCPFDCDCCF